MDTLGILIVVMHVAIPVDTRNATRQQAYRRVVLYRRYCTQEEAQSRAEGLRFMNPPLQGMDWEVTWQPEPIHLVVK